MRGWWEVGWGWIVVGVVGSGEESTCVGILGSANWTISYGIHLFYLLKAVGKRVHRSLKLLKEYRYYAEQRQSHEVYRVFTMYLNLLYRASCFIGWDVKKILGLSIFFLSNKGLLVTNWYNQFDVNIKSCEFHLMSHLLPFPSSGLSQACCLKWDRRQLAFFSFSQIDSSLGILPIGFLIPIRSKWVGQEERKGAGNAVLSWCQAFCGRRC